MAEIDSIVQIQITKESAAVATASFNIPLIFATHTNFTERTRSYTDMDAIAADFDSADKVYVIAQKLFGQSSVGARPVSVVVGRREVNSVTYTPTVANNTPYTLTINGIAYTYTSDASSTAAEITSGLQDLTDAISGITVTDNTGTLTIAPTVAGSDYTVTASANLVGVNAVTETIADALDAISFENNVWYAVVADTHVQTDVVALSNAVATRRKIFGTSTQDPAVANTAYSVGATDVASVLKSSGQGRTYIVYSPTADTEYPEAAWMGAQLAYTPGTNDWDFKRVVGVTVSAITDIQRANLRSKNANMYTTVGGLNIMQDGNMSDGSPNDEIIFIDWLYARLQEQIFFRVANTLKIPFTNSGLVKIENEIRSVLSQAEANTGIDRGWSVVVPDVADIPETLRAQRTAGVFQFRARLAGSVRRVIINGFLGV